MSLRRATLFLCVGAALAPACSTDDEDSLPAACGASPGQVSAALERAPHAVSVRGVRLSSCFTDSSDSSGVQALGATYLSVAADLADAARPRPESAEAVRLGYLVGAVQHGAARTQGIHQEMARRVEQEAAALEGRSRAYRRGHRAGRRSG